MQFYFPDLHSILVEKKQELWKIFWMEWILTLFTRNFDLKTSLVIWDHFIVKGDRVFYKLFYSIFREINNSFHLINQQQLYTEIKSLLIKNKGNILKGLIDNDIRMEQDIPGLKELLYC